MDSAQDSVEVLQATHDNLNLNANLQVGNTDVANGNPVPISDAGGSLTVDATNLDIRDLVFATDKVDVSGSSVTVSATDLDIRNLSASQDNVAISDGTDTLAVNSDGSINVRVSNLTTGTSVNSYNTATVASGATSNHTYTSTGNFYLEQIQASASGKMKIEVQVNGSTRFVQFNSTANPNMSIILQQPILATTGQTVVIIRTNNDNQSQDLYSTISGYEA